MRNYTKSIGVNRNSVKDDSAKSDNRKGNETKRTDANPNREAAKGQSTTSRTVSKAITRGPFPPVISHVYGYVVGD
jgi:hypothetical protein